MGQIGQILWQTVFGKNFSKGIQISAGTDYPLTESVFLTDLTAYLIGCVFKTFQFGFLAKEHGNIFFSLALRFVSRSQAQQDSDIRAFRAKVLCAPAEPVADTYAKKRSREPITSRSTSSMAEPVTS